MCTEVFSAAHGPGKSHSFVPGNNMFDAPKLREHGVKVMETIGKAISSIDSPGKLKPVLMSLGKTHAVQHNVKDKQCRKPLLLLYDQTVSLFLLYLITLVARMHIQTI